MHFPKSNLKMTKIFLKKSFFIFLSLMIVFRFPEDYAYQPAHLLYIIIPSLIFFNKIPLERIKLLWPVILTYSYFFIIDAFNLIFGDISISNFIKVIYWPVAILTIIGLLTLDTSSLRYVVNCITACLAFSIIIAFFEFISNFPSRTFGLSGSPNNLALSIIHLSAIRVALKINDINFVMKLLGAVNLSRSYFVYLILSSTKSIKKYFYIYFLLSCFLIYCILPLLNQDNFLLFLNSRMDFSENPSDS